jgi:PIN domain nuclease of toxin-antitoxin system
MLLLESHIFLWMLADDARLSAALRAQLIQAMPHLDVSAASIWELRITHARGQLPRREELAGAVTAPGLQPRPLTLAHARAAGRLPLPHRDPFDCMLLAQAQLEGLTLVTPDTRLRSYGMAVLWA